MMNKQKELFRNIVIFGIGTFGTKIMQVLLVPLYTIYMTTEEFGIADIINSTNSLISPLLTLGLGNGLLRFVLGKVENEKSATKLAVTVCFGGTTLLILIVPILSQIGIFGIYSHTIPILYCVSSLKMYLSQLCKAKEKNVIYATDGILQTIILTAFCVLLIAKWKWGVKGYLYSIIISNIASIIYFAIFINLPALLFRSKYNGKLNREMLKYSLPLIPNELSWWVIQMSDRYMVIFFCGESLNGIYSMAYKIPGIFNMLVSVFIQAFGISAIKECDSNDRIDGKINGVFFEKLYERYIGLTFIAVIVVLMMSRPLAALFLRKDFYQAWKFIPLLLIAFAIGNLQSFYGSILSGIKETRIISKSTIIGMVVNVALNMALIPVINAYGAAIATIASYIIVYIVRYYGIKKNILMNNYEKKVFISLLLLIIVAVLYIIGTPVSVFLSAALSLYVCSIHKNVVTEGFMIINKLIGKH